MKKPLKEYLEKRLSQDEIKEINDNSIEELIDELIHKISFLLGLIESLEEVKDNIYSRSQYSRYKLQVIDLKKQLKDALNNER